MGMNRIYKEGVRDDATYFVAKEVERTPMFGEDTLFLVGIRPVDEIVKLAKEHNCKNVYFGTGTSFNPKDFNEWNAWDDMILGVLDSGLWATLDFDLWHAKDVHEMACASHNRFIPMISMKLAHVGLFNYNATVKIDDIDFDKTNPGVWCFPLNEVLKREYFTDWSKYENDTILDAGKNNDNG